MTLWILTGTTRVSQYQKGKTKTNLDFLEQEKVSNIGNHLGHMQICILPSHITMPAPHHSVFCRPDALPATQPTASKHWRHDVWYLLRTRVVDVLHGWPLNTMHRPDHLSNLAYLLVHTVPVIVVTDSIMIHHYMLQFNPWHGETSFPCDAVNGWR